MVKHAQTIRQLLLTNCLSVFDHFVGLERKESTGSCFEYNIARDKWEKVYSRVDQIKFVKYSL